MAAEPKQQIFSIILMLFSELNSSVPATFKLAAQCSRSTCCFSNKEQGKKKKNSSFAVGAGLISKNRAQVFKYVPFISLLVSINATQNKKKAFFKKMFYSHNKEYWARRGCSWSKRVPRKPSCHPGRSLTSNIGSWPRAAQQGSEESIRSATTGKDVGVSRTAPPAGRSANRSFTPFLVHMTFYFYRVL